MFYVIDFNYNTEQERCLFYIKKCNPDYIILDVNNLSNPAQLGYDTWDGIQIEDGCYNKNIPRSYESITDAERFKDLGIIKPFYQTEDEADIALEKLNKKLNYSWINDFQF